MIEHFPSNLLVIDLRSSRKKVLLKFQLRAPGYSRREFSAPSGGGGSLRTTLNRIEKSNSFKLCHDKVHGDSITLRWRP